MRSQSSTLDWRGAATVVGLAVLALFSFEPFLTSRFAYLDDYPALVSAADRTNGVALHALREGRALNAIVLDPMFGAMGSIDRLWWARSISVAGIVALAFAILSTLRRLGASRLDATLIAAAAIALPPMVIWAGWAMTFAYSWSALMGFTAGALLVLRDSPAAGGAYATAARYAPSAGLLVAALLIYQPTAQFFWAAIAAWLILGAPSSSHERRQKLAGAALLFGAACALYFLLWRLSMVPYPQLDPSDRSAFISLSELPAKLRWLIDEPLKQSANLFFFGEQGELAVAVAIMSIAGAGLLLKRRGLPVTENLAVLGALIALSHLVNTAARDDWASYRTRGAVAVTVLIIALIAARELLHRAGANRWVWRSALLVLVVGHSLYVRQEIAAAIIMPQQEDLELVRSRVRTLVEDDVQHIFFRMPGMYENDAPMYRYEIGYPSSMEDWVPESMLSLVWEEEAGRAFEGEITLVPHVETLPADVPPQSAVVDMPSEYAALKAAGRDPP